MTRRAFNLTAMRIGRTGAGPLARTPGRERLSGAADTEGTTRTVRRTKIGSEFVRLDVRRSEAGLTSVTIASDTTEPLTAPTINAMIDRFAAERPRVYRTPAITRAEASGYERCGFEVISVLRLLTHDLDRVPDGPSVTLSTRRGRANRIAACVDVDQRAFAPGQSFDRLDLLAALDATTNSRLRVVLPSPSIDATREKRSVPVGFAVTGRAGNRGYLQRVAVDPAAQGHGYGAALVVDALRWCQRHRVAKVVVNTATDNDRALALYRRLGFVDTTLDLLLMERHG